MARMSLTWTLEQHGWARCVVADERAHAEAVVSYVTGGPEELLSAVARLVLGANETRAEFEAEPTVYRWIFQRTGDDADIRLMQVAEHKLPDASGTLIWTSRQPIHNLARVVVRAFDAVLTTHGEDGYQAQWRRPFPRVELAALRAAWRNTRSDASDHPQVSEPPPGTSNP
jgi:hypothetical protein